VDIDSPEGWICHSPALRRSDTLTEREFSRHRAPIADQDKNIRTIAKDGRIYKGTVRRT